jgi:hypothetical protein
MQLPSAVMLLVNTILILSGLAHASILTVPADYANIQEALDSSQPGDTVHVSRGHYHERLLCDNHPLVLASDYFFTGDTTAIYETILDADHAGTILRLNDSADSVVVSGFSMINGLGQDGFLNDLSGGIHIERDVTFVGKGLFFEGIESNYAGGLIWRETFPIGSGSLYLQGIRIGINDFPSASFQSGGATDGRVHVEHLLVDPGIHRNGSLYLASRTNSYVRNFQAHSLDGLRMQLGSSGLTFVRDVHITECVNTTVLIAGEDVQARNIDLVDCHVDDNDLSEVVRIGGHNSLVVDSLSIDNCSHETSSILYVNTDGLQPSILENLQIRNCWLGDSLEYTDPDQNCLVYARATSLENCSFENNTVYTHPNPSNPNSYSSGRVLQHIVEGMHDLHVRNCSFQNNLIMDGDDYSQILPEWWTGKETRGRAYLLEFHADSMITLALEDCVFRNERQPNCLPETINDPWGYPICNVGSVVGIKSYEQHARMEVARVLIEGCDDGGISVEAPYDSLSIHDVWIRNVGRAGILFDYNGAHTSLRNINISGIYTVAYSPALNPVGRMQSALRLHGDDPIEIHNITITDCDLPHLLRLEQGATLRNVIATGNSFESLLNPVGEGLLVYSMLDFQYAGEGNIEALPVWNEAYGAPFLASDSPGIDAGDPATAWNDVEDSSNPGFAMWPSQGDLRNDMGFTGGPQAVCGWEWLDEMAPVLPHEEGLVKPSDFRLGTPFPNPFNPSTHFPLHLVQPMSISIKVFNLAGQEVAVLHDGMLWAGAHRFEFDGSGKASGVYVAAVESDVELQTQKLLLLR